MVKSHNQSMLALLLAGDLAVVAAAWLAAYGIRMAAGAAGWPFVHAELPPFGDFVPAMLFSLALTPLVFNRFELYQPKRTKPPWVELGDLVRAVVMVWALTWIFANFLRHVTVSRLMMLSLLAAWVTLAGAARLSGRLALHQLRRRGWNLRHAAIVGAGRLGQTLFHCLKRNRWTGIEPAYFVEGPHLRRSLLGLDVLGPYEAIEDALARRPVDIVFVALASAEHEQLEGLLNRLANTDVDVRVVPDMLSFHFLKHELAQLDNLPVVTLTYTPLQGWNGLLKRAADFAVSGLALAAMAVPMAIIALWVKLTSPGPVFYRQIRTSLGGRPFHVIKFRTMVTDAERETGPVWAASDDPRVTPVGRFLRRTSLDELPQLVNVLLGDMSLVGPRPERPELIARFRKQFPRYLLRHHARAGLTGWAQVNGLRGQTSLRKRLQYDMFYICNWSIGLDLRILAGTAAQFLLPWLFRPPRRGA